MIQAIDDDEVRAMESRLRASGWTVPPPAYSRDRGTLQVIARPAKKAHKPKPDKGFGVLKGNVKAAGSWLAANLDDAERPLRPFLATTFGLTFDDAGRAVAEAERLLGVEL